MNFINKDKKQLIKNARIINQSKIISSDLLIEGERIVKIDNDITDDQAKLIDAKGHYLIPGIIDDQVHFREPGLTHKANIYTESRAAVAGGVTSFMEMPNTKPPALTIEELEKKYSIAKVNSLGNYSFFMGTSNQNADEALKINPKEICGIKIFMGSSTGNMLVDDTETLEKIFCNSPTITAIHSEDEQIINDNLRIYKEKYGEEIPFDAHPLIRNVEACYKSTVKAIEIANRCNARLHILHISTGKETDLFNNTIPLLEKNITAEVCVHHLWYDSSDYEKYGSLIKCNPAIKEASNKNKILEALLDDRIDVIASDHAPHTWQEKQNKYLSAPSGIPLVSHTLNVMLELYHEGKISLEKIVEKMSHSVSDLFRIEDRGYIKEGYFADLALLDINEKYEVNKFNINYKCAWSPFEGETFKGKVTDTWVSGHHAYSNGLFDESQKGHRLKFKY
ncbi:dihydroorotase [Candidatus Kapabacteria bacterium]|nr:dihydroorotase [Candidatus Kapabacteria bacterium]